MFWYSVINKRRLSTTRDVIESNMENVQANIRDVEGLNIVCIEPVDRLSIFCSETVKRARNI